MSNAADGAAPPAASAASPLGSLRFRLFALLVAFSLGPMLVTNGWGYVQTRERLTTEAFRNVRNVSSLEAIQTTEFLHSRQELLASMAAGNRYLNSLVQAMATAPTDAVRDDYVTRLQENLAAKTTESPTTVELLVLDKNGVVLATSGSAEPDEPAHLADRAKMCLWARGENTIVDGPKRSPDTGTVHEPTFIRAVALRADDREVGTLCGVFRLDIHRELLRAHDERTESADLYLVDAAGYRLCGTAPDSESQYGEIVAPAALAVVEAGAPWVGRYSTPTAGAVMASYTPIPQLGWGILVELPDTKALASIERLKWQALILGAMFMALMVPAMFATARATAAPLRDVADAAGRVAAGGAGERVPEVGATEMVQLARSFNRMSGALREAHDHLEGRIEQRTAELQRSQEFAELLLDSIEQRVLVIDRNRIVVKANRAAERLHGESPVGRNCHAIAGVDDPNQECPVCEVFVTGRPTRTEVTERTVRGQDILHLESFPVFTADGKVDAVVQIGRVVTGDKQLLAQTMHHEKMAAFGLLAAGMAHEIGNPLASIQSQLRLVREMPESDRARETVPVVEKQVQRISLMLRELTDFARRKRDEVVLVSLGQVMGDVARLLGHDPRARGIEIVADPAPDLPGVRAREDHVVQVLLNLGLNAVDAMPDGGTLRFEASLDGLEVVIRVHDTGTGIPSEVQLRLFEPFLSTKASGRGTGLGLFVSRGIVEGLGGTLQLDQTSTSGTIFAVRLPLGNKG